MVLASGWSMWGLSLLGAVIGAVTIPALGVYGPELFPTSLRGRANGVIAVLGVAGSVIALVVAGYLSHRWGGRGPAPAPLSILPAVLPLVLPSAPPVTTHPHTPATHPNPP